MSVIEDAIRDRMDDLKKLESAGEITTEEYDGWVKRYVQVQKLTPLDQLKDNVLKAHFKIRKQYISSWWATHYLLLLLFLGVSVISSKSKSFNHIFDLLFFPLFPAIILLVILGINKTMKILSFFLGEFFLMHLHLDYLSSFLFSI